MIAFTTAFSALVLAAQSPQQVDSMRALARAGPDSILFERVRQRANAARVAFFQLRAAGRKDDSAEIDALAAAERLARAIAVAWRDSFCVRQVARFRSLSLADRQATVAADSLAAAGKAALGNAGIEIAMRTLRESLRRYEALADTAGVADVLTALGVAFQNAQEYDSAEAYHTRAQDQAERIGDYRGLAKALRNLGIVSRGRRDLPRASELYTRAGELFERIGDNEGVTMTQNNLGGVAWRLGDLVGARRAFEAALAGHRSAGNADGAAMVLHNLGGVAAELGGDYAEAARRVREALSIYRERGDRPEAAVELFTLGQFAIRRGDYRAAIATLSEAAGIMSRAPPGPYLDEGFVRLELAQARRGMGDLQGARTELQRAEALASGRRGTRGRVSLAGVALAQGDLAVAFNRLAEAEREYARAQRLARGASDREVNVRTRAQYALAGVLFMRESYHRAQVALDEVLRQGAFDLHNQASTRLLMGEAAWRAGDTGVARRAFGQALDTLRALGAAADEAQAFATLGRLEVEAGHMLAAESLYQRGLTRLGARPAPGVEWQLHAGLAGALRGRGALAEAARELESGIAEIERVSGSLPLEEQRAAFRADKWDVYVELALVERARGRTEAAFEASERLRERQMLDLLARGRVAVGGGGSELASREQDLRRRMGELAQQVEAASDTAQGLRDPAHAASGATSTAFARAQEEYRALLDQMREANPPYAALVHGEVTPVRDVMNALAPDEALLEYLVGDSTTIVFVVTADSVAALDLKVTHDALAAQVDFARSTLASPKEGAARRAWRPPLRRLYQQLVAPVEESGLLAGKRRLLIAPHAELHYLPFAALVRPGPPDQLLVERYVLEYVPSASVWLRLRGRPAPPARNGVLALAPHATALPGSRAEVAAIRRIYGDRAQTLIGTPATERAFRTLAPEQEIVHLATYGVLNKHNPLFSYVELGAGGGEDGRLEVHEVFGLTLHAHLLVLSACQTGVAAGQLADVPPGDDWVGLVQGFLYAGASNVLATLWPVADVATARLMERFYSELAAGRPEAEALALAQRAAARGPGTAHPFFWAGFALVRGR